MKILEYLPENIQQTKIAWVIRHAHRIDNLDQLSDQGLEQAQQFGKQLRNLPINAIYASPTDRCTETAKIIAQQLDKDIPIILDDHINEVGVYVTDMQKALDTYHSLGKEKFFYLLLTDQPLDGYNIYSKAAEKILNFIRLNTTEPGITLFITHHFIIRMLNHYLRKLSYKDKLLKVDYLKGIIIKV